jgi:hypothetical protein
MKAEFRLPIGNNKAGFPPGKIGHSGFPAINTEIGIIVFKYAPLRQVGSNRQNVNIPALNPYCHFKPNLAEREE